MAEYKGQDDHASSSRPLATPTKRTKRLEQTKSHSYSPYPKGSPRTPARRVIEESSLIRSPRSQPSTPQSPGMRAITSIISLLTPFGSRQARASAAFGDADLSTAADEDEDEVEGEEQHVQYSQQDLDETRDESMDQTMEEPEPQQSIYPSLPSKQMNPPAFTSTLSRKSESESKQQPRQSIFYSAPRHSTPSRSGFGGLASATSQQAILPSASVFTFGDRNHMKETTAPAMPTYPRTAARSKMASPLSKNYDLLARFFAEKAQQSTFEEDAPSAASLADGETGGEEGGLTEMEVAGCMRLIEESLAQGKAGELERLRGDALERASLRTGTPHFMEDNTYTRGYMSRSPSLPLGAAAGEMSGTYGLQPRPSSSFLSPSYQNDDARINRSLANTFGSNSVPAKRRHRPLYLGPGQGAGAASNLLRRNQQLQQQRKTLASRSQLINRSPNKPIWHREETDQEDRDASGSNVKRRRMAPQEEDNIIPAPQARSLSSSQSLPALFFNGTPSFASPPTPEPSVPDDDEPVLAPPRTATADAMLSILSAGPSIPVRKTIPVKKTVSVSVEEDEEPSGIRPEIVNPYQTRSRLTKRASVAPGASSLAAKEKERLKEEREKRQRLNQESKTKPKENTLKAVETADSVQPSRRGTRRNKVQEDEERRKLEAKEKRKEEQKEIADAEAKETERRKKAEANEAEEKRKLEAKEAEKQRETERERKTELVKQKMEKLANQPATPAASSPTPASEDSVSTPIASGAPRKSFAFGSSFAPKKPSPLSQADNMTPDSPSSSSDASERDAVKPFSFLSTPGISSQTAQAPIVKMTATPSLNGQERSPREQALAATSTSLPKFDFAVDLISSSLAADGNNPSRAVAKEKVTAQLPVFELIEKTQDEVSSSKPAAFTPPTFSFGATNASASAASKESSVEASSSEAESESKASDATVSALLSGKGEGEENEDCLHEVRSKVWTLKDGKWADLGIGLFKIKKNSSDGRKRVLVRNEGNGKVMVNFRLMESFKPMKDKNVVSFLGFDGEGKPTNYRCKVKTDHNANELAGALQRAAV